MGTEVFKLSLQPAAHADVICSNACSRQHMHAIHLAMHVLAAQALTTPCFIISTSSSIMSFAMLA